MEELLRELTHLGMSDKEAAVYVASLELGSAPVQDIAHRAKVNRATTYVMIESLVARGLMSTFVRGKKRHYAAEAPERLRTILRLQRKELEEKESELDRVLPTLTALFNSESSKPHIRYLEGSEGVKTVRDVFERLEGEFVQIVPISSASIPDVREGKDRHILKLIESGAAARTLLVFESDEIPELPSHLQVRCVSPELCPIQAEITVRGNHVFLFSYRDTALSVVIVSQEIAQGVRALFNLAWVGAKTVADSSEKPS
jgi:sugar-specific transcriptional regulator TrmB